MTLIEILFWLSVGLLVHTHLGYPLVLAAISKLRPRKESVPPSRPPSAIPDDDPPMVSLIIAAHDEQDVIVGRVANALALDWQRDRLEVVVASDGSTDRTVELAGQAGADLVLDLARSGKIATQNAAVEQAGGEIVAFSDANAYWERDALRELILPFADPAAGYVCGQVRFTDPAADNEEGAYWRYEMAVRRLESDLGGVTAGNGAIYAVRREAYLFLGPSRSHDLNFPFQLRRHGWRCRYAPAAVAEEKMVPSLDGELARKRRMMVGLWDIVIRDGMLWPRRYGPMFAFEIYSHRVLRNASPCLHLIAFALNLALLGQAPIYLLALLAQLALLGAAWAGRFVDSRPLRVARYYVEVTASIALGLWDRLRQGSPAAWERAEGTR